jgi:hypothetical protein
MAEDIPIVPFGKYKGQPVTSLMADTKYIEWLKNQEFFKKHTTIYNICITQSLPNNESCTPEHNKLQNLFLDNNYCKKLFMLYKKKNIDDILKELDEFEIKFEPIFTVIKREFEAEFNWDMKLTMQYRFNIGNIDKYIGQKNRERILLPENKKTKYLCGYTNKEFKDTTDEFKNFKDYVDIESGYRCMYISLCSVYVESVGCNWFLEIKPLLGNDYPNVLRKMKTQMKLSKIPHSILFVDKFSSESTTVEQLIEIFYESNICIVFKSDLD